MIVVCPLPHLDEACRTAMPSHVVTMASPGKPPPRAGAEIRHLHLSFHDLAAPRDGHRLPDRDGVEALLAFGRSWTGGRPLVVACELGISRSPAAALALACAAEPTRPEHEIAAALRRASPCATPNPLLVRLADDALGRGGAMSAAVQAIGRGAEYRPYRSFALAVAPEFVP